MSHANTSRFSYSRPVDCAEMSRASVDSTQQYLVARTDTFQAQNVSQNYHQCPYCYEKVFSRALLQRHMSISHVDRLPFSCHICNRGFFTQSGLQRHISDHGSKRFACQFCDIQFKRKQYLVQHLKSVHKVFPCQTCWGVFHTSEEFSLHVLHCGK